MELQDSTSIRIFADGTEDVRRPLKKSVDTLAIVPTKDRISILARKVYNVMMHFAQEQGAEQPVYRVLLREIVSGIDFNSKNTEVIKDHLRQMVTTKVEWQSPSKGEGAKWAVSAMLAHAELMTENGDVYLEWSYAVNIKHAILDPQRYARISLAFQSEFRSMPGLVLYEICSRYVDNPGGLTARQHWTWWRPVLTGSPESQVGIYSEWKYFKRDVVKGAVKEVNRITDLEIEAIEHRAGRAIGDLQFRVKRKEQKKLPFGTTPTPVSLKDIGRAIIAGVPQDKAERLLAKYGDDKFTIAVDALEVRQKRKELGEVRSPEKYLSVTLSEVVLSDLPSKPVVVEAAKVRSHISSERIALLERFREGRRQSAESLYNESTNDDQKLILSTFESEVLPSIGAAVFETYRKRGLLSPMTRSHFAKYLAEHFFGGGWESPSDAELLDFTISGGRSV